MANDGRGHASMPTGRVVPVDVSQGGPIGQPATIVASRFAVLEAPIEVES